MGFFETIFYMIWRGIAIGIIISAPMGPVGILCVQRTLEKGRRTGFFTGIGAAISDMIYCLLTGFGLSFIEDFLTRNHNIIQLIGSVVLIGFGIYLFKSNPSRNLRKPEEGISDKRNILNGFLFTFSNPLIIFLIIGLFARFNFLVPEIQAYHYFIGFASIGAGALIWWWLVTFFVAKLRSHFNLRSMWLINKIIGGIILIFALVGIITAISEIASAKNISDPDRVPENIYMNTHRGFHHFKNGSDSALVISGSPSDTVFDLIPLPFHEEFELSFRATNIHNRPGKSYKTQSSKIKHPAWGIVMTGHSGNRAFISFSTIDNAKDETYSNPFIKVQTHPFKFTAEVDKGMDIFSGENAFFIKFSRGHTSLSAGNREYRPILSFDSGLESLDSIGFFVVAGGKIEVSDLTLESEMKSGKPEITEFGNPDILYSYLLRSTDKMEGIWKVYDRTLDEDFLRLGGDYSFALVKSSSGYDLIYLSGARTENFPWIPGMIKARLRPTGFSDIFDVSWTDASGHSINSEIKAEGEYPFLTLLFPYESSNIRLRKVRNGM